MDQRTSNISSSVHYAHARSYKPAVTHILKPLETFSNKYIRKKDCNYCIEKLYALTSDPVTQQNKLWIERLLHQFFRDNETNGFKIKHLSAIMQILEFLALKARDIPEYKKHLSNMLELCFYPPLLEKSSDHLLYFDILVHYFTVLGYLIVLVSDNEEISKILKAIRQLLVRSTPVEISAVKLEFLHRAVEKSRLPLILTDLIQISSSDIFQNILDTTFTVAFVSNKCCHRMFGAGIFNYLLARFADLISNNELDENLLRTHINDEIMVLTNILWLLIKSILPRENLPSHLLNMPPPDNNVMRSLRKIFQSAILNSKCSKKFLLIRNDLAAIILGGIVVLPSWHLVSCGIAEDIIAAVTSSDKPEQIRIANDDNLIFEKILLAILCYFSESGGLISIMKENGLIKKMIHHLNCGNNDAKVATRTFHFPYLMSYQLRTLAILALKMPDEFVIHEGSTKLLTIFKWCMATQPINTRDIMEIVKTICTIATSKSSILLADFRKADAIPMIYKFLQSAPIFTQFFTQHQRILTFLIITIECIMMNHLKLVEIYEDQTINILIKIMERCRDREKNVFPIDERLLITIGSFIGECIVWYPTIANKFIVANGIYIMLDIMENTSLFVRNVYFKTLVDFCTSSQCIPYICTWRERNKRKGFMSLLARSWREEEINCGVKRTREGCIEDVELPLMAQRPGYSKFHSRTNHDFSPTIASMIGSIRPKIYSIRKILLANSDVVEKFKEHYKIFLDNLPVEDTITFCIIDQYFRFSQGQVWLEVLNYLEQVGVNPLGTDGQLLLLMSQRHRGCAMYVQNRQEKLLKDIRRKELIEERDEFIRIRDESLTSTLTAAKQMDYIRRTTHETYRMKRRKQQIHQINAALFFPSDADAEHCQRTFNENWNITPIPNQNETITNHVAYCERKNDVLPPVSPSTCSAASSKNQLIQ